MIWFIFAIVFAILAFYFHNSADKLENSSLNYSQPTVTVPSEKTYWELFKNSNPTKANEIENLLGLDFSTLSDRDVKEKIETIEKLCKGLNCSISQIKDNYLNEIRNKCPIRLIPQIIESIKKEMANEVDTFHILESNTCSALMIKWLKEYQKNTPNDESYWEVWKSQNPEKAKALIALTKLDFAEMDEMDVKQIIDSFERVTETNGISDWNNIKNDFLKKFEDMSKDLCEEEIFNVIEKLISQESEFAKIEYRNTASFFVKKWYEELFQSKQSESLTPEEAFRKKYRAKLFRKMGTDGFIPLFCHGYDSPIAHELMYIMYQHLRNGELKAEAEKQGLWGKYIEIIIEETEKVTKKYCHVFLQECIEYYNFPDKPVVTRHRCPSCGSTDITDDSDFGLQCDRCGKMWNAPYGKNLYL